MKLLLVALFALLAIGSAFKPQRIFAKTSSALKNVENKLPKAVLPAALVPFVAPLTTFAAEGTGRAFGIDDNRLVVAALLPSLVIVPLYLKWSGQQESDDFFDGYEKRRQG